MEDIVIPPEIENLMSSKILEDRFLAIRILYETQPEIFEFENEHEIRACVIPDRLYKKMLYLTPSEIKNYLDHLYPEWRKLKSHKQLKT